MATVSTGDAGCTRTQSFRGRWHFSGLDLFSWGAHRAVRYCLQCTGKELGRAEVSPRCHKTGIARRLGTAIIASRIAATLGGDMAEASVDFRILAGAGAPVREFKAGEVIFKEGDPASE